MQIMYFTELSSCRFEYVLRRGLCLHLGNTKQTWDNAATYCEGLGGHLVDLPDQNTANTVKAYNSEGTGNLSSKLPGKFIPKRVRCSPELKIIYTWTFVKLSYGDQTGLSWTSDTKSIHLRRYVNMKLNTRFMFSKCFIVFVF